MIRNLAVLMAVLDLLIGAGAAFAWTKRGGGAPPYNLAVASSLEERSWSYPSGDLDRLQGWLAADVERALIERREDGRPPLRLRLVLEDARPSRSLRVEVSDTRRQAPQRGGVTITGSVTREDGRAVPIVFRAYRRAGSISDVPDNWADARAAFRVFGEMVADDKFARCAGSGCSGTKAWRAAA